MIGADGLEEGARVEAIRVAEAMDRAHSTERAHMAPPSPKRRRRPLWLITLLIVVGCGWLWLPLGIVLAGLWLCLLVVVHLTAKFIWKNIRVYEVFEGDTIDGVIDDQSDKP